MNLRLTNFINVLSILILYWLIILAIGQMVSQSPIAAFLFAPVVLCIFGLAKYLLRKSINYNRWWLFIQIFSFVLMLIVMFRVEVDSTWDWKTLLVSAYDYASNGQISNNPIYFFRYTHNQFWLICLIGIFKIVIFIVPDANFELCKHVSMILGGGMTQLAITFVYLTAKLMWNDKKAFCAGILSISFLPFYLYAMFLYSDVPGMMISILLIYFFVKYKKFKNNAAKYCAIIGLLGALAYNIKILSFIVVIAIIITFFCDKNIKSLFLTILVTLVCIFCINSTREIMIDKIIPYDKTEAFNYRMPAAHFINMMLKGNGGYNSDDVQFSYSFDTYNERKQADMEEIKKRLEDMGMKGTIKHLLYIKQLRTWTNSFIGADYYISTKPLYQDSVFQKIFSINGNMHWVSLIYTWIIYLIILLGLLLSSIFAMKDKDAPQPLLVGRLTIIGIILFLTIWECNSRYLLIFMPIIILTSYEGISSLYERYAYKLNNI